MSDSSDQELMTRIRQGDHSALGVLYDRHAPQCLAISTRVLGDQASAEDVLQELFVRLWEDPDRYDPARGSVTAWLVSMIRSRSIDRLRRRATRERVTERASERAIPFATAPGRPSSTVVQAVAGLPQEQREAIELAYFEGLSQTEIARRLETPLGTIKSRLRLGMSKLRLAFDELTGGAP